MYVYKPQNESIIAGYHVAVYELEVFGVLQTTGKVTMSSRPDILPLWGMIQISKSFREWYEFWNFENFNDNGN